MEGSASLSRRGFLRGLLAAPAIVAAAHIMPVRQWLAPLILWGDGVHNDTAALNAFFRGEEVIFGGTILRPCGLGIMLPQGIYRATAPIIISRSQTVVRGSTFISEGVDPAVFIESSAAGLIFGHNQLVLDIK